MCFKVGMVQEMKGLVGCGPHEFATQTACHNSQLLAIGHKVHTSITLPTKLQVYPILQIREENYVFF
jgi:hypothetical protein